MERKISFEKKALEQLNNLEKTKPRKFKKVKKTLGLLSINPKHPSLNVHKYESLEGDNKQTIWECYVENKTLGAWRIFFFYGPDRFEITIYSIETHS